MPANGRGSGEMVRAEAPRGLLDQGINGGALSAMDAHVAGAAERLQAIVIDGQRGFAGGNHGVLAVIFASRANRLLPPRRR